MPIARVQMPDGRIARIEVPEGTTPEQAQRIAQSIVPKEKPTSFWQGVGSEISRAGINSLSMMEQGIPLLKAGSALFGSATGKKPSQVAREALKQAERRSPYQASTAGRIVGGIAASVPTMAIGGTGLAPALAQGALGGAMLSEDASDPLTLLRDTVLGALAGGLGYGVGKAGGAVYNKVRPPKVNATPPKPPRADIVRAERLRRAGVQAPTTAMVTRNPAIYRAQTNALGREAGAPVQEALVNVNDDLIRSARGMIDAQGGTIGAEATGERAIKALQARDKALSDEVGALYTSARENFGDVRVSNLENLKATFTNPEWQYNPEFDNIAGAVSKRLAAYADADSGATGLTVKQAEEMRKFIANLGQNNPQTFSIRRMFQDALDADVLDNVGGEPFKQARTAARARFEEFRGTPAGKLVEERIAPEALGRRLAGDGMSLDDLRSLRTSLEKSPGGNEALQALRAQQVESIVNPAINPGGQINGGQVYNNFNKQSAKLRTLLDSKAYKDLRRYALASRDATTAVPFSGANFSQSGNTAVDALLGTAPEGGMVSRFLKNPLGRAGAHIAVAPLGGVGNLAVEGAAQVADVGAQRAVDQATQRAIAAVVSPEVAAQQMAEAQQRELLDQFAARYAANFRRGATPIALGSLGGLGLVAGN
jgi:hypothetical protein